MIQVTERTCRRVQLSVWAQEGLWAWGLNHTPQMGCGSSERGRVLGRETGLQAAL